MERKYIIVLILSICTIYTSEAQFFKKLKEKAEAAVERVVLKKTDSLVEKKTEQSFDSISKKKNRDQKNNQKDNMEILGSVFGNANNGQKSSKNNDENNSDSYNYAEDHNLKVPDTYQFSYKAVMEIKTENETVLTEYFLEPDAMYYAKKQTNVDFPQFVVYDASLTSEIHFAEIEGKKRRALKKMDLHTKARLIGAFKDGPDKTITPIGTKKILEYECKGFKVNSETGITTFWIATNSPATSFGPLFNNSSNSPDINQNSMVMEVEFISKDSMFKNYHLSCVELQSNRLTLDYNLNK